MKFGRIWKFFLTEYLNLCFCLLVEQKFSDFSNLAEVVICTRQN